MNTIEETRRLRLDLLLKKHGSFAELNEKLNWPRTDSRLSRIKNQNSRTDRNGKVFQMGSPMAREIETSLGLTTGWMDTPVTYTQESGDSSDLKVSDVTAPTSTGSFFDTGLVHIPQYATGGAMGHGLILKDQPGIIKGWTVSKEWLQKNARNYTSPKNLAIVTGFGDSMRPIFQPGDPLLVDTGITTVDFDGIYFFRVGEEGFVKRLQRIPGEGIVAISENKAYRDWTIKPGMDFEVFGRVVKAWSGQDY